MANETTVKKLPARNEISPEDTWRLEDIFPSDDEWNKEYSEVQKLIPDAGKYQGRLGESAETLYAALQFQDHLLSRLGKLYTYAHMRYDQDTTNSFYQGMDDKIKNLYSEAASALAYIVPELLAEDEEKIAGYLKEKTELQLYKHSLEEINLQRPHVLSAEQESLLAQASEVLGASSNTFGMLNNADLEFPSIKDENGEEVEITHGRFIRFLESDEQRVRHDAFKAVYETYGKFRNTFASTLSGNVKKITSTLRSGIMTPRAMLPFLRTISLKVFMKIWSIPLTITCICCIAMSNSARRFLGLRSFICTISTLL